MTHVLATRSLCQCGAIPDATLLSEDASISIAPMLSTIRTSSILESKSPHKITSAIDHSWFRPSITPRQRIILDLRLQLRNLIFLHVHNVKRPPVWVVMNRGRFFCMQYQQSSTNNHDRYNKSTHADHAVIRITSVPSAPMHTYLIK